MSDIRGIMMLAMLASSMFAFWKGAAYYDKGDTDRAIVWMMIWLGSIVAMK